MLKKDIPRAESSHDFPVVGIGASAGGLSAFRKFLGAVSKNSGIAYVLVQHLDPHHESSLPELLQKTSKIPVHEITDHIQVEPNNVYIIPSNKLLLATDGILKLSKRPSDKKGKLNLPINLFFNSLAKVYGTHSFGVVLSGTASDGTMGLKVIRECGGITFAQDETSAEWPDMPRNAIIAGVVDFVMKPEAIPAKILELKETLVENNQTKIDDTKSREIYFRKILSLLRIQKGTDFTYYKQNTIRRRVMRRMVITKYKTLESYLNYLRQNKKGQDILYQDLLIPVTFFFRESKIFNDLCDSILPLILQNKREGAPEPIRLWIAGCSTGQEVYSFAICLQEYFAHNATRSNAVSKNESTQKTRIPKIRIFATDISEPAIAKARKGIYTSNEIENVAPMRLKRFFTKLDGSYLINQEIREMCVFAAHDFLTDPPFGRMDLISCRNVLIYLQPYLQKKALKTFHYALNRKGYLLLGKSESINGMTSHFEAPQKNKKFFRRKDVPETFAVSLRSQREQLVQNKNKWTIDTEQKRTDFQSMADEVLIKKYVPASVVVNESMDIVLFRGNTDSYLAQQGGKPSHNLLKMAKEGLAFELRNILHKVKKNDALVKKENVPVFVGEDQEMITIEVSPLANMLEPYYLVVFSPTMLRSNELASQEGEVTKKDKKDLRIERLEKELAQSREDMRDIMESQETVNEELQSTNEELLSGKEELQSLNEELETSKEELQSTNEELTVLNQELQSSNDSVTEERNFAHAIIMTIREPLLVLDEHLKVITANKAFYETFKVKEEETEGELLYNLGNKQWNTPQLSHLLESILPEAKIMTNYEVVHTFENIGKRSMLLNAREIHQNVQNKKMILLAIEDISEKKQVQEKNKENLHRYHEMIYSSPSLIAILEGENFILSIANDAVLKKLDKGKDIIGKPYFEIVPELKEQGFEKIARNVYRTGKAYYGHETPITLIKNGKHELSYYNFVYQPQKDIQGEITGVALMVTEVTVEAELHKEIKEREERYKQIANLMPAKITSTNAEGEVFYFNQSWLDFTGLTLEELQKEGWVNLLHPEEKEEVVRNWQYSAKTGEEFEMEIRLRDQQGDYIWHLSRAIAFKDAGGKINLWVGACTEIQKIKREEKRKEDFLKLVSHELKTPVTSIKGYAQTLLGMLKEEGEINYKNLPLISSLERIDNQVSRLTRLISEMLDLSRLEESQLELQKKSFSVNKLVDECIRDIEYSNKESKIKAIHTDNFNIYADYDRIGQVIINFITNAIKYSPEDKNIEISVFKNNENEGTVKVKDYGIGLADKDKLNIFKRFYRVSGDNEETYSGLGIGLYLAKEIINRHGSHIEVLSEKGNGSSFIFAFPIDSENKIDKSV